MAPQKALALKFWLGLASGSDIGDIYHFPCSDNLSILELAARNIIQQQFVNLG